MQWLRREHGVRRWCIVGNDYVWPRVTARSAHIYAGMCQGEICFETCVPLGWQSWRSAIENVRRSRAHAVLMLAGR